MKSVPPPPCARSAMMLPQEAIDWILSGLTKELPDSLKQLNPWLQLVVLFGEVLMAQPRWRKHATGFERKNSGLHAVHSLLSACSQDSSLQLHDPATTPGTFCHTFLL